MTDRQLLPADLALDALRDDRTRGETAVTSLSVDEAILLDQVGYQPIAMVTGASVVGVSSLVRLSAGFSENTELTQLSVALEATRTNAINRITDAGQRLGAVGVVGVSLDVGDIGEGANLVHLIATGTAVRPTPGSGGAGPSVHGGAAHGGAAHGGGAHGRGSQGCFTAALSGHEVHLLARAGYVPLGIVSGVCAYHVGRRAFGAWAGSVQDNQEMTIYTEALYDARELAMGRLQDMALVLDADGVVGVVVTERTGVWGSHVIEFSCIGTAVRLVAGAHQPLDPRLLMDLAG
jgi:uncharacterized protein YbjQ (UPF0145 family)